MLKRSIWRESPFTANISELLAPTLLLVSFGPSKKDAAATGCDFGYTASNFRFILQVKIWIRKVPPTSSVEGIDVSHYAFRAGQAYEVGPGVAKLLIVCGYAEPERRGGEDRRDQAADRSSRRPTGPWFSVRGPDRRRSA